MRGGLAELADADGSKSSDRKVMGVQVPRPLPVRSVLEGLLLAAAGFCQAHDFLGPVPVIVGGAFGASGHFPSQRGQMPYVVHVIVRGILPGGCGWKKLLSQDVPGGVVKGVRGFQVEQRLVNDLLIYSRTRSQKLDLADLLGKIIECLAVRLPNV